MKEFIKFGFGFYIGYEMAKVTKEIVTEAIDILKKRVKDGTC